MEKQPTPATLAPTRKGFISYAHADHALLKSLLAHLRPVERAFDITFWWDRSVHAGSRWSDSIATAIAEADIALLLITPDLIASDYVIETEIPALQQRHASGALVIPVVMRQCLWEWTCGSLQGVPTAQGRLKPVAHWRPQNYGNHAASAQIAAAVESRFGPPARNISWPLP
jgi:hypothetical protein